MARDSCRRALQTKKRKLKTLEVGIRRTKFDLRVVRFLAQHAGKREC